MLAHPQPYARTRDLDGAVDRPLRADHGPGGAWTAARHPAVGFELFPRRLPEGRRYGVVAGTGRVLDAIEDFRFDDEALASLRGRRRRRRPVSGWPSYRFCGDVWGYAEGEVYFPGSPMLASRAPSPRRVLLETLLLSILNHDSAIASAAARMAMAAGERPCIEMGSRRTHEQAAVASARAAYLAGFASTSTWPPAPQYGVPTAGTRAHAFTLLHDSEADAFRAQVDLARRGHHVAGRHLRRRRRRCGSASRSRVPRWAPSASTPATSGCWPTGSAS